MKRKAISEVGFVEIILNWCSLTPFSLLHFHASAGTSLRAEAFHFSTPCLPVLWHNVVLLPNTSRPCWEFSLCPLASLKITSVQKCWRICSATAETVSCKSSGVRCWCCLHLTCMDSAFKRHQSEKCYHLIWKCVAKAERFDELTGNAPTLCHIVSSLLPVQHVLLYFVTTLVLTVNQVCLLSSCEHETLLLLLHRTFIWRNIFCVFLSELELALFIWKFSLKEWSKK